MNSFIFFSQSLNKLKILNSNERTKDTLNRCRQARFGKCKNKNQKIAQFLGIGCTISQKDT